MARSKAKNEESSNDSSNYLLVGSGVVGNIISVVGVVICNKYITQEDGFNFMVFLSFLHFTCTAIGTRILLGLGVFHYKTAATN